jgi:hypothetical protein
MAGINRFEVRRGRHCIDNSIGNLGGFGRNNARPCGAGDRSDYGRRRDISDGQDSKMEMAGSHMMAE